MFREKSVGAGKQFIDPLIAKVFCLHGVFAGLGLMVLAVVHH